MRILLKRIIGISSIWYIDFPLVILYGAWLGRFVQLEADSGEYHHEKVIETVALTVGSFIVGYLFASLLILWKRSFPSWILAIFFGSSLFAVLYGVVVYSYRSNVESNAVSSMISEQFSFLVGRAILQTAFAFVPVFVLLFSVRVIVLLFKNYRQLGL